MTRDEEWLLMEKYNGERSERFFDDCRRLTAGVPLAYVIGWVPFLSVTIHLDSRPLIPRPETEYWTEQAIAAMQAANTSRPLRILDLCAGSGCIGIAAAKALPNATIDLAEYDLTHHSTIQKNIEANQVDPSRIRIIHGDLFEHIDGTYDFILTNPPYIDPAHDRSEDSVKRFEPHTALYGGRDGIEYIKRIIADAPRFLKPGGQLWLEHEPEQSAVIQTSAAASGFSTKTHTDQYGAKRWSVLVLQ